MTIDQERNQQIIDYMRRLAEGCTAADEPARPVEPQPGGGGEAAAQLGGWLNVLTKGINEPTTEELTRKFNSRITSFWEEPTALIKQAQVLTERGLLTPEQGQEICAVLTGVYYGVQALCEKLYPEDYSIELEGTYGPDPDNIIAAALGRPVFGTKKH